MNTAFIQDCADVEIIERQRAAIADYAREHGVAIDNWVNAGEFVPDSLNAGDVLMVEKTFRLAKDVRLIALLLEKLLKSGVSVCSCADGLRFDGGCASSLATARLFGAVAQIAEELHSRLTKEGLQNVRRAGQVLGRPRGGRNKRLKLTERTEEIADLLANGWSRNKIAQHLHVHPATVNSFIQKNPRLRERTDIRFDAREECPRRADMFEISGAAGK